MSQVLANVIDLERYPLKDGTFRTGCKRTLDENGALVMHNFVKPAAIASIQSEGEVNQHLAYYTVNNHNIYLKPSDPHYPAGHPRNREVASSKGCITTDQIPDGSVLHTLYDATEFREFLCAVLGEAELHEYGDAMSSINLHYAGEGQELGWHFDNSSFAITLLIQIPESGGVFEYVKDVRDADSGEMNYGLSGEILDGNVPTKTLAMDAGALVLFRGRNSMHRVTPVKGSRTRMLVVLAYNTEPGLSLSESARMTFYGRLGVE
ncbi:MAG: 2OG-Fe(II) oxygenase [Gammaproteobacteria bacterium]|nr:2OG-Fe(II) oxygenase [Gammaproteobacteria bacterium]